MNSAETQGAAFRLHALAGRPPLGAIFAATAVVGVAAVGLLRLDRLPWSLCYFKALTGCACPTCGTTRALGRLFAFDLPGALAMNPLATAGALLIALWGLGDLALLPRGRAVSIELSPAVGRVARVAAVALVLANWAYLLVNGR